MAKKKGKTLTREDVLKKIEENEGTARGLNLSEQTFVEAIDLSNLDLKGIILNKAVLSSANFNGSDLSDAKFIGAKLGKAKFNKCKDKPFPTFASLTSADFSGADLTKAKFIGAFLNSTKFKDANLTKADLSIKKRIRLDLHFTDFRGADLSFADFTERTFHFTKLEGAYIRGADITEAYLGDADWGNYKIGEEIGEEKRRDFYNAEHRYRHLKAWYTRAGYYDIAAKFYYREMEVKRKASRWHWKRLFFRHRLALEIMRGLFGYGERWERILIWIAFVIFGLAAAYYFWGSFSSSSFWDTLYYSAASFTALGYGQCAPQPTGWAKGMGAAEAVTGVFMMALLLVTFVRKWTR